MKNLENKTVSHSNERREKTFREAYPFSREDVYPNGEKSNVNNYIIVDDGVNVMTKDGFFSNKYTIHYTNVEFIPEDEIEARLKAERKKHPELVLNKEIVESNAGDEKAKKTKKLQTEVHTDKTGDILYADDTIAAKIVDGEPLVLNEPSSYVLPSLMGWLQKKGFKAVSKEQILHDYKYEHMKDISKVESKKKGEDIIKIIKNLASRKKTEGNLVDRLYSGFSEIRD
ncbi:MAG: hypothetical protein LBG48_00250, partial [Rickettsiales bacterium]|nr:hypothetical protein [Rickettsiales bacterium]